jgi:hypothetical protein
MGTHCPWSRCFERPRFAAYANSLSAGSKRAPEIYWARSRKLGFTKLLPTSPTGRVRKRTSSDIICKQRRSSASHSFIWFRISRRSYCVVNGSAIRRQATVCQSFNSPIFLFKLPGSVMSLAPAIGKNARLMLIPKNSLTSDSCSEATPAAALLIRNHCRAAACPVWDRPKVTRTHPSDAIDSLRT